MRIMRNLVLLPDEDRERKKNNSMMKMTDDCYVIIHD